MRNLYLVLLFSAFSISAAGQSYLGSWTLDWSQVLDTTKYHNPMVDSGLQDIEKKAGRSVVWVFSDDSLKVLRGGQYISKAAIRWTNENTYELINSSKKKKAKHFIEALSDEQIRMSTNYDESELYLRKL